MNYNPFNPEEVPLGERSLPTVVGTLKMMYSFTSNSTEMRDFIAAHKQYLDVMSENILKNVGDNPNRVYRISVEGRGQAYGDKNEKNTALAVQRAQAICDAFIEYFMGYSATKNGETRSVAEYVSQQRLVVRPLIVKPYFDTEKGMAIWVDGKEGDKNYQRAKLNLYYESKQV